MTDAPADQAGTAPETRLARLVDAVLDLGAGLSLPVLLRRLANAACALVDARYGAIGVLGESGRLVEFVPVGITDREVARIGHLPEGRGILGLLITEPRPLRLADLHEHPDSVGFPPGHPAMRSFLGVPVRVADTVFGNLYLCDKTSAAEFSEQDEELVVALAAMAGTAIESARLHDRLRDLAVLTDRERIARDLHDKVIQRLFATGISLQATARLAGGEAAARVLGAADDLDDTIREIRSSIFELETQPAIRRPELRVEVLALAEEMLRPAGVVADVHLEALPAGSVEPDLADEILAVVREALANVVRHSGARRVEIEVHLDDDLVVWVRDDGGGMGIPVMPSRASGGSGRGLRNLASRAEARGGSLALRANPGPGGRTGTTLEWRIPRPG